MNYGFAVDIGTSTIKIFFCCLDTKEIVLSQIEPNNQIKYGSDIISRVLYAHYNSVDVLRFIIINQIKSCFDLLYKNAKLHISSLQENDIKSCVITGNTVMLHFLTGLSVDGFEQYPFTTKSLFGYEVNPINLFKSDKFDCFPLYLSNCSSVYLPLCIDAFIGADASCAALSCDFLTNTSKHEDNSFLVVGENKLLIDIGTNCEVLLSVKGKIFACSTAAGPAFEGKGLSVNIKGSELVHNLANMLKNSFMDNTGLLSDEIDTSKQCILNQKDIRTLQLAKGAICAAVETLLKEADINTKLIDKCFICGNFGGALSITESIIIGLLPQGLENNTIYEDNAAGKGAIELLVNPEKRNYLKQIIKNTTLIQLADNEFFKKRYIERMNFTS